MFFRVNQQVPRLCHMRGISGQKKDWTFHEYIGIVELAFLMRKFRHEYPTMFRQELLIEQREEAEIA